MEDVLVPLLIFGAPARRRAEITERLLPAAVPGSAGQRLAFAAVVAQQQISSREQAELRMVKEAAARFAAAEDLAKNAPTLHRIYAGLPEDVRKTVEFNTDSPERRRERERERRQREALEAAVKEQTMKEQRAKEQTAGRKA
jgi:hypothetical protein